jgi:uncharacterized OB-fold protein
MRDERPGLLLTERLGPPADIPISLPGHLRNLVAKVGFSGSRCGKCDTLDYPTRYQCSSCGAADAGTMERLPTTGTVYTVVTVRVPVPGLSSPYSIAVVDLDGEELRVLARVTGTTPGDVAIGERGRFLLRRIATRTGVPDYAGSFQTGEDQPVPYEGAQS